MERAPARGAGWSAPRAAGVEAQLQTSAYRLPTIAPAPGAMCWSATPPIPLPGLVPTATQAVVGFAPGCSGNVEPGSPGSAHATVVPVAIKAAVIVTVKIRRFKGFLL